MSYKSQSFLRGKYGFTLAELMVSVGVVVALAILTVPTVSQYRKKISKAECETSVKHFLKVQELYYLDNNTYYPLPDNKEVKIAWEQQKEVPPARPEKYSFPKLAIEFKRDNHRRYRIKAESRDGLEFKRKHEFELKTDEDFDNDGKLDYYSYKKSIWQKDARGTYGDADIDNNFWFDIHKVPAWSDYKPSDQH